MATLHLDRLQMGFPRRTHRASEKHEGALTKGVFLAFLVLWAGFWLASNAHWSVPAAAPFPTPAASLLPPPPEDMVPAAGPPPAVSAAPAPSESAAGLECR